MTAQQRHAGIVRLFREGIGGNVFTSTILSGPRGHQKTVALSYLAMYADGDFPYVALTEGAPAAKAAAQRILGLTFPNESARDENDNAQVLVAGTPRDVDAALWAVGVQQVKPYDLPVIFVTFLRSLAEGTPKIVLWYPRLTQGQWAFNRLQRGLKQRKT